ncbi:hypothetical protein [Saccharopolyspora elongata]|uniref:hypothetical protein n=1 Tax=Saccharopolyspora elongata TaxID=2530387 RepID=UPI001F3C35FA
MASRFALHRGYSVQRVTAFEQLPCQGNVICGDRADEWSRFIPNRPYEVPCLSPTGES